MNNQHEAQIVQIESAHATALQKLQEQHDRENEEYITQKTRLQGEIDQLKAEIEQLKAKIEGSKSNHKNFFITICI